MNGESSTSLSFCTGPVLDGSILEVNPPPSDFVSSSGSGSASTDSCNLASASASDGMSSWSISVPGSISGLSASASRSSSSQGSSTTNKFKEIRTLAFLAFRTLNVFPNLIPHNNLD